MAIIHPSIEALDAAKERNYLGWTRQNFRLFGVVQIPPFQADGAWLEGGEPPSILDFVPESLHDRRIIIVPAPDIAVAAFDLPPMPHMFALLVANEVEIDASMEQALVAAQ